MTIYVIFFRIMSKTINKKADTKVKTVMLPGERGPEIQYRLTGFHQTAKRKTVPRLRKAQNAQISAKNVTTNVIHNNNEHENTNALSLENKNAQPESTMVSLKDKDDVKISRISDYQPKPSTEFCCANDNDTTGSWISGIEFVQDDHIILLDTNNCKLKRFNTLFRFQSEVEVPVDCASMTKISDKEIAVTCLNEVHFYSIGHFGMSRSSKHFEVSGDAYGISYGDGKYVVTCDIEDEDKCAIRILDIFGDEIHVIKVKGSDNEEIDIGPYCQIDNMHQVVAVSDFDNRFVRCYNFNGSLKWKCEVAGGPRGLLKIGNDLIVSDNYGQEICAITIDTGKKRTLLQDEDGVFNPELIACNDRNLRLAITQRAFDTISIFNLSKRQ